ncbi:hypothetical protein DUI87_27355 [Hirundo rustica rustica]|uniref:Uncharacterized protein n=1 Tax=Hirundo rustica rustica TaxID=333673 RepID=A0A3M0J652_HIRRU|nr:hypothetical protein DUI87_27355 [Hirundo rustica rustica]
MIDVTEVQIFIIIMHLLAVIGRPSFLAISDSKTEYSGAVGKNASTLAGTSVLSPFLHIGSVIALAAMIYKKSAVQLFERHLCLYTLTLALWLPRSQINWWLPT